MGFKCSSLFRAAWGGGWGRLAVADHRFGYWLFVCFFFYFFIFYLGWSIKAAVCLRCPGYELVDSYRGRLLAGIHLPGGGVLPPGDVGARVGPLLVIIRSVVLMLILWPNV